MACDQYSKSAPSASSSSSQAGIEIAQAAPQHQVRAARDHVDRVDLEHAHAADGGEHIRLCGRGAWGLEQSLGRQHQRPGSWKGQSHRFISFVDVAQLPAEPPQIEQGVDIDQAVQPGQARYPAADP